MDDRVQNLIYNLDQIVTVRYFNEASNRRYSTNLFRVIIPARNFEIDIIYVYIVTDDIYTPAFDMLIPLVFFFYILPDD